MSHFGLVLKEVRAQLGLSQQALAMQLGSTQRHVSFLETGRSAPTPSFLARICRELKLSIAQRANLFDASGLANPYARRSPDNKDVTHALNMIDARLLAHWPFPGAVLDEAWFILRTNPAFDCMIGPMIPPGNEPNLLDVLLSPDFRDRLLNWDDVLPVFYYRLQASAAVSPRVAEIFERVKKQGLFDGFEDHLTSDKPIPVFVPFRIALAPGLTVEMSSILGRLVSTQDAALEGYEIELMMPTDAQSEETLRSALNAAGVNN